jgi:acyl dehydratase
MTDADTRSGFDLDVLGRWTPAVASTVTAERIAAYAAAVDDPSPEARSGRVAPPVFAIVPAWEVVMAASRQVAPPELRAKAVHGQQDLVLHHPLVAEARVRARAAVVGVHGKSSGTQVVIKAETHDEDGRLLSEQFVTEFYRGVGENVDAGEQAPALPGTDPGGAPPVVEVVYPVGEDMPRRYAEASGDHNRIHLDDDFARSIGLPGVIVHGLCSLALAARAVQLGAGVPSAAAFRRVSCRFRRPLRPGDRLTTRVWPDGAGDRGYRFESVDGDGQVVLAPGFVAFADGRTPSALGTS